ncbi:4-hydroxythreonine-4-phosphate dehydrogenase [hydrothermal vent metagenome]|uniref:4-hydroxythreonine-4-phosphate dehydrogenase n=1 Tax=hydrothermal vent metagenome TaxID=652676 RepID=A0A3B0Z963_9ZZZZ
MIPRIAITTGEPAGIGPELCATLDATLFNAELVLIGDLKLLNARAALAGQSTDLPHFNPSTAAQAGKVCILPITLDTTSQAGHLDPGNAAYVIQTLDTAIEGCLDKKFDAMVTAPIHKAVINDAGKPFTGHTEYLAEQCDCAQVVMMLAAPGLRVALATTHLPLSEVPSAITRASLEAVIRCLHHDLQSRFRIELPRILIAGLNPHAGEDGHLGHEDDTVIRPVVKRLVAEGLDLTGPLPADTLFTPPRLAQADAVLCMYHDQGLPVLKYMGFGRAINITLGLPIIRTSVDHGTALDIAGTGQADPGSLVAAIHCAIEMAGY